MVVVVEVVVEEVRVFFFFGLIDEATAMRFFEGKEWRLDHRTRRVSSAIR